MRRSAIALAAGLLVLAACGSTVNPAAFRQSTVLGEPAGGQGPGGTAPAGGGIVSPSAASPAGGSASLGGAAVGGAPSSAGGSGGPAGAIGGVQQGGTSGAIAAPGTGPIQIGFIVTNVSNAGAFGVNAGQTYTDQQLYDALVAAMNKAGGLDGRKIVPVYGVTDTASADWNTDFQAACASFTQDHHVAAVLGYIFVFLDGFESCLARAGVPHLYGGYQPGDRQAQQEYPTLFATTNPTDEVHYTTVFGGAIASGLLTPSSKLGIVTDTCGHDDRAFSSVAVPYLQRHHIHYETFDIGCASGASDDGKVVSLIQNAELRFRADGDNPVFVEGVGALVFAEDAESQHWTPTYVMSVGGAGFEGNVPGDQLSNFHGFGWMPEVDVDPQHQPAAPNATQQRCLAMLASQGLVPKGYNDYLEAFSTCDALFMYNQALTATQGNTAAGPIITALSSVASRYAGASTYDGRNQVTSLQRGGPAVWREWAWATRCSCFQYTGPTEPMITN